MEAMPRPRPPHLHRQVTRHGKTVWYVRVGRGPRIRIRSAFGTPEFDAEYQAAIAGVPARQTSKPAQTITGSLAWLIERYRETGDWTRLSLATRRLRENIFRHVVESAGIQPVAKITTCYNHGGARSSHTDPGQALYERDAWPLSMGVPGEAHQV